MLHLPANSGWLEVITGCMQSGKTDELRRRIRTAAAAHKRVALFTSDLDATCKTTLRVELPDGRCVTPHPVRQATDILAALPEGTEVVGIDEAQFFDGGIRRVITTLVERGVRTIVSALDTDFRGQPFGFIGDILAQADQVTKLHAVCPKCGETATRTQRLVNGRPADAAAPTIQVVTAAAYEPRCRACHMVPDGD